MSEHKITTLSLNPLVAVIDDFFDAGDAHHIIELGRNDLGPSNVLVGTSRTSSDKRSNLHAVLDQWQDARCTELANRLSAIVRLPPENAESAKLLCYRDDQKFDPHFDAYSLALGHVEYLRMGGQRLFTTICYLNDVDEGGETVFPALKIAVTPRLGRVLMFSNTVPGANEPHPHALHAGTALTAEGEKWVLSLWWREQMYHVPRDYPQNDGPIRKI
ncbi:MAG: 2OG-Fe(II) oxygenase [Halocynthiibacter sp.]